jgi:hypothetical protein
VGMGRDGERGERGGLLPGLLQGRYQTSIWNQWWASDGHMLHNWQHHEALSGKPLDTGHTTSGSGQYCPAPALLICNLAGSPRHHQLPNRQDDCLLLPVLCDRWCVQASVQAAQGTCGKLACRW